MHTAGACHVPVSMEKKDAVLILTFELRGQNEIEQGKPKEKRHHLVPSCVSGVRAGATAGLP